MVKKILAKSALVFLMFTVICGIIYTFAITGVSQLFFKDKANGSIIEIDGVKYGSELLGQNFTAPNHMWGRIMNVDVSTYKDENGDALMYASPSNLSPASAEFEALVAQRVEKIHASHPEMGDTPIPSDLVTCSGSGLDPSISPLAAEYQVKRLARENGISEEKVREIIEECTTGRFLGLLGEPTVNVLKVNLMLDEIL